VKRVSLQNSIKEGRVSKMGRGSFWRARGEGGAAKGSDELEAR